MISFEELFKSGVHFGHQVSRWCPKMAPYIWGYKSSIHLIDVSKTAAQLEQAGQFLQKVASEGKTILWVGTKKPAQEIIYETAKRLNMPYVNHRWIGGTLSNYGQVKKSVTKLLHYEDIIARAEKFPFYTKKEINTFQKLVERLKKNIGGILNLTWPIGAIILVDVRKERSALREAARMGIPVVALVDTNSDPSLVDYVIPGNDDAPRAIKIIIDYLAESVEKGVKQAEKIKEEQAQEKAAKAAAKKEGRKVALKEEDKKKKEVSAKKTTKEPTAKKEAPKKTVEKKSAPKEKVASSKDKVTVKAKTKEPVAKKSETKKEKAPATEKKK